MDVREAPAAQQVLDARAAELSANPPAAAVTLKEQLGNEGIVKLDPLTGTARFVGSTGGFLTAPSSASAQSIAMDYLRAKSDAIGLTTQSLGTLQLARDYVSIDGTHHLFFRQVINGIGVFGNGVKVNVTKSGQIINVLGSPVKATSGPTTPVLTPEQALLAANQSVEASVAPSATTTNGDLTLFRSGDTARLVYFQGLNGLQLAYSTLSKSAGYSSVVDAMNGKVLYRRSTIQFANGLAFLNRPGAANGGTQQSFNLNGPSNNWGFGTFNAVIGTDAGLSSNNTWVYSDLNDSNGASLSELVRAQTDGNFNYPFTPFTNTTKSPCTAAYPCSWNSTAGFSWQTNRAQNATQVYFFVNNFHDHTAAAPIGFNEAAGNFQMVNSSGQGADFDAIIAESDDGANTAVVNGALVGLPDGNHIDNANMNTPPDGDFGHMQMYLFNFPFAPDTFLQVNGGDEASVIYHEFTHGLSNRLVVDADGNSTLGDIQAGAMGEAWSDWYAEDFLVRQGLVTDTAGKADVLEGDYVSGGDDLIRTEPIDCKVGSADPACDGDADGTAGTGGYTYGDYGKIIGRPEVHADGEIWAQTLWDLRDVLGSDTSESLVTRAMELSPANPSMLDMRNSILQADLVAGGANHDTIWNVFAHRGMGWFAGAVDGNDAFPVENFAVPPTTKSRGSLVGKVTDADTGKPIQGAVVGFGGHASGFADDIAATTMQNGLYQIRDIIPGTYPKVFAKAPGYDTVVRPFTVIDRLAQRLDWTLRRNWAELGGGASIVQFTGPNFAPDCPPEGAIDGTQGLGWGSTTDDNAGHVTGNVTPKFIIVKLPANVNISAIQVDPSNTCGDPGSSSTRGYRIQSSTDGVSFTTISEGVFGVANRNRLNDVSVSGAVNGVRYLKFWMLNPQVPDSLTNNPDDNSGVAAHCGPGKDNGFGGCQFMDMTEMKVYGRPSS